MVWSARARPHLLDASVKAAWIHMGEVVDQGALDLVEHPCRDDGLEELVVERCEEEIAGNDRDQEVGVDDGDTEGHQS